MRGLRRFSQAISEGDGISLLAEVDDAAHARVAAEGGVEGIVVRSGLSLDDLRDATDLPLLLCTTGSLADVARLGADACLLVAAGAEDDEGVLERRYSEAVGLGLDTVVEVRDEDELQLVLDRVDPEIFLLAAPEGGNGGLEHVLGLLTDLPAGKLAVAELDVRTRDEVTELERAGVDAVIVRSGNLAPLLAAGALDR